MNIGGRWVTLEFVNTLFGLWIVLVALLVAFAWWFSRHGRHRRGTKDASVKRRHRKRSRQPRHKS